MSIEAQVPVGNPQAHFRVTPNDDNARASFRSVISFPFTFEDAVSQVIRFPIPAGVFVRGVLVKFDVAFDAANADVGDSTDADGYLVDAAVTTGVVNSYGSAGALAAAGGKYYAAAGLLTITFADAITAGEGTLLVDVLEIG